MLVRKDHEIFTTGFNHAPRPQAALRPSPPHKRATCVVARFNVSPGGAGRWQQLPYRRRLMARKQRQFSVAHKGFFIVGTGLLLELLLLSAMAFQLFAMHKEQMNEAGHRDKSVEFCKVMLADVDAGVSIMRTWRQHDLKYLTPFDHALKRADNSMKEIARLNKEAFQMPSAFQVEAFKNQQACAVLLTELKNITLDGLTMENLHRIASTQYQLTAVLQQCFDTVREYDRQAVGNMNRAAENRRQLGVFFVTTLIGALALNVA